MPPKASRTAFLAHCETERRLSPLTLKAYSSDLNDFARFRSLLPAAEITTDTLRYYLREMTEGRQLSVATVKRRIAALRSYFSWCAETGIGSDPTVGWQLRMKRPRRLPRTLTREELGRLVRDGPRRDGIAINLLLRLLTTTGIRVGELCGLDAADVTPDGTSLHIRGKGARDRIVYVPNLELSGELRELSGLRARLGQEPLFVGTLGTRLSPASVRRSLHRLARERGCGRRVTPHMFRHTAATLLIEEGVDIRHIQRLLGHASIATTEIYTHVADESLRRTLARADVLKHLAT
jgi:site-specific recombinase XerD